VDPPIWAWRHGARANAEAGLERLRDMADTVIVCKRPTFRSSSPTAAASRIQSLGRSADAGRQGHYRTYHQTRLINLDFADVRTVMQKGGVAMIGLGESDAEDKAVDSVKKALRSPLWTLISLALQPP